jgi:hypothetical protein
MSLDSDFEFKPSTIRKGRYLKARAQDAPEAEIGIRGRPFKRFKDSVSPALKMRRVSKAVSQHRGWLESEWREVFSHFRQKEPVPFDDVLPYFQTTLEKRFNLYARTLGKPIESLASDPGFIDTLCEQAAFDFIMSLRMSAQEGEKCKRALKIATHSFWRNPMDMRRLGKNYEGRVDERVITRAVLGHSKNPEEAIERYIHEVARLSEKYKKVDQTVIKTAAHNYPKKSDAFIDWYVEAENYLYEVAPELKKDRVRKILLLYAFRGKEELSKLV